MISVLIPVFNRDVQRLVQTLSDQLQLLDAEIIVLDDGSEDHYRKSNSGITSIPLVRYAESDVNRGRISTRLRLAMMAKHTWLLFLDCDTLISSDQFIKTYLEHLHDTSTVTVGGRIYAPDKPADCRFMLHWKYGSERETSRLDNRHRVNRFMTNNFLIAKSLFESIAFTELLEGYGYEDTWMAMQFEALHIQVNFINNPAVHDGIEPSSAFVRKSEEALVNLSRLSKTVNHRQLSKHVRLYDFFYKLKSRRMLWVVKLIYLLLKKPICSNLRSCNPSLLLFDLYRLHYFISSSGY